MRKPVIHIVFGHSGLLSSIGIHAEYMHIAVSYGIEPYVFSVRTVFRAVIKAMRNRKLLLFTAGSRYRIYIVFTVSLGAIRECIAIG